MHTPASSCCFAYFHRQVVRLGQQEPLAVVDGVLALIAKLPVDLKGAVVAALRRGVIFADPFSGGGPEYRVRTMQLMESP